MTDLATYIETRNAATRAWLDEDPTNRWAGFTPGVEHWAEYGITTVEQFERFEREESYSDLYKSTYGFRPDMFLFKNMTDAEQIEEYDSILSAHDYEMEQAQIYKIYAAEVFEIRIAETIILGAADRKTAIDWIIEAEDETENVKFYGYESLEYRLGLEYGYIKKSLES